MNYKCRARKNQRFLSFFARKFSNESSFSRIAENSIYEANLIFIFTLHLYSRWWKYYFVQEKLSSRCHGSWVYKIVFETYLLYMTRRDVAFPRRSLEASQPDPSPGRSFFLSFFLLFNFTGDQWFLLLFTFFWWEIFKICPFSLHSRVPVFSFLFFLVCVCVGGHIPPTHTY